MRHDPAVPLRRLAWNRPGGPYWFHYTTVFNSEAIVRERAFKVGDSSPPGLYVTTLHPGQLDDEGLLNELFDGTRNLERVQAAVVLHDDPSLPFERVDSFAYRHPRPRGAVIDLEDVLVGRAFKEDGFWRYDRSLWDYE